MKLLKEERVEVNAGSDEREPFKIAPSQFMPVLKKANELGMQGYIISDFRNWGKDIFQFTYLRKKTIKELWKELWNNLLEKGKLK